jgi:hypothetical protein
LSKLYVDEIYSKTGTSKALEIDSSGYVKHSQFSGFYVRLNNSDTTARNSTSNNPVINDWIVDNDGDNAIGTYNSGDFDLSSGIYTTPYDGLYDFSTNLRVDGFGGSYIELYLVKNAEGTNPFNTPSNRVYYTIESATASDYTNMSFAVNSVKLNAGEKIGLNIYTASDSTITLTAACRFSGKLVTRI